MKRKKSPWEKGDMVEFDGLLAVVVGIEDDHLALWFGDPQEKRISKGGKGKAKPEFWLVPEEYCIPAQKPIYRH